jgi:hypothetical protein
VRRLPFALLIAPLALAGCDPVELGSQPCEPDEDGIVEPVWMAGFVGTPAQTGAFGSPDGVLIDARGLLLAGDEHEDFEQIHVYQTTDDDPDEVADLLAPIADLGVDSLEFEGVAGLAQSGLTGQVFVVERRGRRVQILEPIDDHPYFEHVGYLGRTAPDLDDPDDGEWVRPQAVRVDSLGRVYVTDDGHDHPETARHDVQVFDADGDFLYRFGDSSQGEIGVDGNLGEPEDLAIDEARNRIYVCDEQALDVVAFRYDDRSFVARFGGGAPKPNGVDVDHLGNVYVVYEDGAGYVRVFEPEGFTEISRFGESSSPSDETPGTWSSPGSLYADLDRDLLVLADQGHDRIQGFRLSEVQQAGCFRRLEVSGPRLAVKGATVTIRVDVLDGSDEADRYPLRQTATLEARAFSGGGQRTVTPSQVDLRGGTGVATLAIEGTGIVELTVRTGGLEGSLILKLQANPTQRKLSSTLTGNQLSWSPDDGVVVIEEQVVVPEGERLSIAAGTRVMLGEGASIRVLGDLVALGAPQEPIHFFAADPERPWGRILHEESSEEATYRYAFFGAGGDSEQTWHCCGAVLDHRGGDLVVSDSVFAGGTGKGILARGEDVEILRTAIGEMGMGAELGPDDDGLVEDSWFGRFGATNDGDGLYLRGGGDLVVRRVVVADAPDDGIDTFRSDVGIDGCLIFGVGDKGLSIGSGDPSVSNCLVADSVTGVTLKNADEDEVSEPVFDGVTIVQTTEAGLTVSDEAGANANMVIRPRLQGVIIWDSGEPLETDYELDDITVEYSLFPETYATGGTGAAVGDPLFIAPWRDDFQLNPLSPAVTAGPGGAPIGFSGF